MDIMGLFTLGTLQIVIFLGAIYSSLGYGLSMSFGVARFINFSYGELLTISAFSLAFLAPVVGFAVALLVTILFVAVFGVVIARVFYKPVRPEGHFPVLITSLGVGIILRNSIGAIQGLLGMGGEAVGFPISIPGGMRGALMLVAISVGIFIVYDYLLYRTDFGSRYRATTTNETLARMTGIDTERVISISWFIASVFAAVAGVMLFSSVAFRMHTGFSYLLTCFTVILLGGIGRPKGCIIGGFIVALASTVGNILISPAFTWAYIFIILIAVLVFKPEGLFEGFVHP